MNPLVPMIASTVVAATPLIYAALGETVVEKAGVLNLGIEGMMLIGAVAGFAATLATGSDTRRIYRGGRRRRCAVAGLRFSHAQPANQSSCDRSCTDVVRNWSVGLRRTQSRRDCRCLRCRRS